VKYASLIWSALWRKPAGTLLTGLAATAAFTLFALMMGLNVTYRRAIEAARVDRLYVTMRFVNSTGLPVSMEGKIERIPGVTGVGGFASICGYRGAERGLTCVFCADEGMQRAWAERPITATQWRALFANVDGMLVSGKAARRLGVRQGDLYTLRLPPGFAADGLESVSFKVLGIVPDEESAARGFVLGNLKYFHNSGAAKFQGVVGGYRVAVKDGNEAGRIARAIDGLFANSGAPTLTFSDRTDAENSARSSVDMALLTRLIAVSGLLMILFLLGNAIARSVQERMPEFAVLHAVGFARRGIGALVFLEAAVPCVLGAALGTGIAAQLTAVPTRFLNGSLLSVPPPTVSVDVLVLALACSLAVAASSSAAPLIRLWSSNPAATFAGQ